MINIQIFLNEGKLFNNLIIINLQQYCISNYIIEINKKYMITSFEIFIFNQLLKEVAN